MKYGDWQLRDNSVCYPAQYVILYPSSNSSDRGSLHTESNVRSIVRRVTSKSYKLNDADFHVKIMDNRDYVVIGPGEANIQGYHLIVNTDISIKVPDDNTSFIKPYTLGISLSYDASNNVTGDVIAYDKPLGENEYFSGAYAFFFDSCELNANYDNILVLGRAWVQDGKIVVDGTSITGEAQANNPYIGYKLAQGFEPDPFNDHAIDGKSVEVKVEGAALTAYDAIQNSTIMNIADISKYATMHYEAEQNPSKYTKPPTITTDLQDYLNYMIDWYPSKFGDCMTGALRFDNLSLDAKRIIDPEYAHEYTKDTSGKSEAHLGAYHGTEGVFISPRGLHNLNSRSTIDWDSGGTLMSVVPKSYSTNLGTTDGTYSALVSSRGGQTGLKLRADNSGTSQIVHFNDGVQDENNELQIDKLLIENISGRQEPKKSSMFFNNGQIFIDSYSGSGIQLFSGNVADSSNQKQYISYRFDQTSASVISAKPNSHRTRVTGIQSGSNVDTIHISYGITCDDNGNKQEENPRMNSLYTTDPYLQVGNLMIHSNRSGGSGDIQHTQKIDTIRIKTPDAKVVSGADVSNNLPFTYYKANRSNSTYIRMLPGIYTDNAVVPDYIQVGVSKENDIFGNETILNTKERVLIYKREQEDTPGNYTAIEQDTRIAGPNGSTVGSQVFNMMRPFASPPTAANYVSTYKQVGGIYSFGNIGASTAVMAPYSFSPYAYNEEWVRFTRFRYDRDQDTKFGGDNEFDSAADHYRTYGSTYNIEFNTNIRNRRANQIIWGYYDEANKINHQPLTLSYIHDEYDASEEVFKGTTYPNSTYYDHNMYVHNNPTYGVRDFLRIDGGGLSIHGDVNNPTLAGNDDNDPQRFGMTLLQGRIYASVYNDYAETYEKSNPEEAAVEGMVVMLDSATGKYKICDEAESTLVVGVISDNYGMLIGGKSIDSAKDHLDSVLQADNFAIGVSGKLFVNVISDEVAPGDLLVSASKPGLAEAVKDRSKIIPGTVIGKALSKAQPVDGKDYYQCLMQIMLS